MVYNYSKCVQNKIFLMCNNEHNYMLVVVVKKMTKLLKRKFTHSNLL